jgi:hypothetical protein
MMKRTFVLLLLALAVGAQAQKPGDFASGLPLDPGGPGPFARVPMPASVYVDSVRPGLADLGVFNAEGEAVPFAVVAPRPPAQEKLPAVPLPMFPLRAPAGTRDVGALAVNIAQTASGTTVSLTSRDGMPVAGERLVGYVLDAREVEGPLTGLSFALPEKSQSPTMRVTVEGTDSLVNWKLLTSDAPLVNLEFEGRRVTRDRIDLAPAVSKGMKYLRVTWPRTEIPIDFTAVSAERGERPVEPTRRWSEAKGTPVIGKSGEFEYDIGGAFPVDRIAVDLTDVNSVVPAQVLTRGSPTDEWRPVLTTVFYRLGEAGGEVTPTPVAVAGNALRYWLLRVDPRAGTSTAPPKLRAGWQAPELVFAVRGTPPFTLAYGRHAATPGPLPISTLIPGYDAAKGLPPSVSVAKAGPPSPLGGASRPRESLDVKRWLLWAVLALASLVLGWMAYRLTKQIGPAPPPK